MRSLLFALVALGLAACGLDSLDESETVQGLVNGVGFSPPTGGTVGSVQVGQSSIPFSVDIYPISINEVYYSVTAVTGCSDFSVDAPNLPGEVSRTCLSYDPCPACVPALQPPTCNSWTDVDYVFTTTFHPTVPNPSSCAINLTISGLGTRTYTINGTGTVPPIDIDVTPTQVAFGDVRRNTASTAATVNARNAGGQAISVTSAVASAGFTLTSGPAGAVTIPVGSTQAYGVTCNPTATGALNGTLRITSNDPMSPAVVNLTCNGIDSNLDVSPSPAAIPTTRVGEPVQRTIALSNTGAASMLLQSTALTGAGISAVSMPPANTAIAPGGSVNAIVGFAADTAGDAAATLTITYDGGQQRAVQISAKALATSMSVAPDGHIDLGPVCVGQSKTQDVAIAANAEGPFKLTAVSMPTAPFTLVAPSLPANVQGLGANHLTLTLGSSPTAVGPATAAIMLTTDIPGATPHELDLDSTGLAAGVSATPAELNLGPSQVNSTTIGQEVQVTNCSTTGAVLSNPRLEGQDAGDFAIVEQPSLMIGANGTARWLIVAQPHSAGAKTAMFSVDHAAGTSSVILLADGLSDQVGTGPPGAGGRASYYQCSTGTATTSWPVGLALGALLLRRRRRVR